MNYLLPVNYLLSIRYPIKWGETKEIDLPVGKHHLIVRDTTGMGRYKFELQNEDDVKKIEVGQRIPDRFAVIVICVVMLHHFAIKICY
jgi:hypothetical protein